MCTLAAEPRAFALLSGQLQFFPPQPLNQVRPTDTFFLAQLKSHLLSEVSQAHVHYQGPQNMHIVQCLACMY